MGRVGARVRAVRLCSQRALEFRSSLTRRPRYCNAWSDAAATVYTHIEAAEEVARNDRYRRDVVWAAHMRLARFLQKFLVQILPIQHGSSQKNPL